MSRRTRVSIAAAAVALAVVVGALVTLALRRPAAKPTAAPPPPACSNVSGGFPGDSLEANFATALAWSPDGRLFYALRGGQVMVYQSGSAHQVGAVPVSTSGERGLLGLALSPNFKSDHFVFAFYSRADDLTLQRIVRWTECAGDGRNLTTIVDNLPAGGDCCHKGGRIAFGTDGKLYVTVGDNHVAAEAQDRNSLRGKVLRYNPDGGVAPGNPFGNAVWIYGLRNPFGIAFSPDGNLGLTNNGPSGDANTPCGGCGDIFDLVGKRAGVDYQWPYCWGYGHAITPNADCHALPNPDYSSEGGPYPKSGGFFVAPTGVGWVSGGRFGGHFVFCAQSPSHLFQYVGLQDVVDTGVGGCALDVKQGPDGALYMSDASAIHRAT